MIRGTTPTITFNLSGYDVTGFRKIHITLRQKNTILTKTEKDLNIDYENNTVSVALSQKETLMFQIGIVEIQLRAVNAFGEAMATSIRNVQWLKVLEEEVI